MEDSRLSDAQCLTEAANATMHMMEYNGAAGEYNKDFVLLSRGDADAHDRWPVCSQAFMYTCLSTFTVGKGKRTNPLQRSQRVCSLHAHVRCNYPVNKHPLIATLANPKP